MRVDNSHHLQAAAKARTAATRRRALTALRTLQASHAPLTVTALAAAAAVSRSWIYTQPDLLEQLNDRATSTAPAAVPARQHASEASQRLRLHLAHRRIRELEADNDQLRAALAQALGDQRVRHARTPPVESVTTSPG